MTLALNGGCQMINCPFPPPPLDYYCFSLSLSPPCHKNKFQFVELCANVPRVCMCTSYRRDYKEDLRCPQPFDNCPSLKPMGFLCIDSCVNGLYSSPGIKLFLLHVPFRQSAPFNCLAGREGVTVSAKFVSAITVHLYRLLVIFFFPIQIPYNYFLYIGSY